MTAAPNRRRKLIIALLLALATATAWWNWPRGDARFVGKWQLSIEGHDPHATMTLHRNGVGTSVEPNGATPSFPWYVDGNQLVMGHGSPFITTQFLRRIHDLLQSAFGRSPIVPAHSWEIVDVGMDYFLMRPSPGAPPIRCSRIPE